MSAAAGHVDAGPHVLYVHATVSDETYRHLLDLYQQITPVVQALPPQDALLDVAGATRYFDRPPAQLATLIQTRALALYGVPVTIGLAPNRLLATMAADQAPQGQVRGIEDTPEEVAAFLRPLPVGALHGVGPALAATLAKYGVETVGQLATTPLATVQRILGGRAGRQLHEYAHGWDPRPVEPGGLPQSMSGDRLFDVDTTNLATAVLRRALLEITVDLATRLRQSKQAARTITVTVRFAGDSRVSRQRTLAEATSRTEALRHAVYQLFDGLGLQRARVRAVSVRVEGLIPAAGATEQISLDQREESERLLEPSIDRANRRFGPGAVVPGSLIRGPHSAKPE